MDKELVDHLTSLGIGTDEVVRLFAPGSTFDQMSIDVTCKECGKKENRTLREIYLAVPICACGVFFDLKEIGKELKLWFSGRQSECTLIHLNPHVREDSDQN